jgi:hypothetical protein
MAVLARIEHRYRLPAGYFKTLLPHLGRATSRRRIAGVNPAEQRRLAWHLPDDFSARAPAERAEILAWVRTNVISGSTEYRRFQADACKHRFALRFGLIPEGGGRGEKRGKFPNALQAPAELRAELQRLVTFKTATLTDVHLRRNGHWCAETATQRTEHLSLLFGALAADPAGPTSGFGVPTRKLTFALLAFPTVWDWYLNWRLRRRGFFTVWEVDMLRLAMAICRRETGWLRQSPDLAGRLATIPGLLRREEINEAQTDWSGTCDRLCEYAGLRAKEVAQAARVHRDPFEPILPILEASSPLGAYRLITEEILRRIPDRRRYPRAAAEAVRAFLMLRLGLHLGVRQRNLRQLMLCQPRSIRRSERELETMGRGELRWDDRTGKWEVLIPSAAFKNARSSFFASRPFRLALPDLGSLYDRLDEYIRWHRAVLLKGAPDPGTLFVKTVKASTRDASYNSCAFYEAWRLAIQRYGIWNPYTNRGAIRGLLPHGPHCVRDVLATHILKETGSYEQAGYAIQDTAETVAKHYGRFLPHDKASFAADILNSVWADGHDLPSNFVAR